MQQLTPIKSGKVREIYDQGDKLVIVTTDRVSAFDKVLPVVIQDKGKILTQLSSFWFTILEDIVPNHMISTCPKEMPQMFQSQKYIGRSMMVKKLKMIPIECVVRGYITGSGWESYKKDGTVCGIKLPDGLKECQKIDPIFTPTTKEEFGHDRPITYEELVEKEGEEVARQLKEYSINLYCKASEYAAKRGIIIADTKFEFGFYDGVITLADEVLTPDSSRFWPADQYCVGRPQNSFDKQPLRDWITESRKPDGSIPSIPGFVLNKTRERYIKAFELLTGMKFIS